MANNEKNFCPLPWVSLCVQPYGPALCCSSYVDLRSHPDESPAEVFQNKTMTDIREKFLNNEWPSQCRTCQKNEERGVLSYRQIVIRSGVYDDLMAKKEELDRWGIIERLKE